MTPQEFKDILAELEITRETCAKYLGVNPRSISRWIEGGIYSAKIPGPVINSLYCWLTLKKNGLIWIPEQFRIVICPTCNQKVYKKDIKEKE